MRSLVNDRSAVIKNLTTVRVQYCGTYKDYIAEAEKQIGGIIVYKDVNFKEKKLEDLSKTSNKQ